MKKWKAYPKYKDSGVEWLGAVPEGWEVRRIDHIASVKARLGWKGLTAAEYVQEGYIFLATPNIKGEGAIDFENVNFISEERYLESPEIMLEVGDVLLAKDGSTLGTVNRIKSLPSPATVNSSIAVIRASKDFLPEYLFRWLSAHYSKSIIDMLKDGQGVPHLFQSDIKKIPVCVPPLAEQKAIAAFLDKKTEQIDRLIAKKKALIERLNEKRTALITESVTGRNLAKILEEQGSAEHGEITYKDSGVEWLGQIPEGWEDFPMRRVAANVKTGATPSGVDDFYFSDDGLNWYTPGDFDRGIRLDQAKRKLSEEGRQEVRVFSASTVLMVGIGATIGKVAVISGSSAFNQQINGIIFELSVDPLFAAYFLTTLRDYIFKCGKYTTLPIINQDETKSLPFVSPPLAEQKAIAAFLDKKTEQIDELQAKVQSAIEKLQEYRIALITAAVTGKIDVRGEA